MKACISACTDDSYARSRRHVCTYIYNQGVRSCAAWRVEIVPRSTAASPPHSSPSTSHLPAAHAHCYNTQQTTHTTRAFQRTTSWFRWSAFVLKQ